MLPFWLVIDGRNFKFNPGLLIKYQINEQPKVNFHIYIENIQRATALRIFESEICRCLFILLFLSLANWLEGH